MFCDGGNDSYLFLFKGIMIHALSLHPLFFLKKRKFQKRALFYSMPALTTPLEWTLVQSNGRSWRQR